jgi:hypothetical protein
MMAANQKRSSAERQNENEKTRSHSSGKDEARDQKRQQADKGTAKSQSKSNRAVKGELRLEPGKSARTIDHKVIRAWIEERGGKPATVKGTEGKVDPGLLRVDFPERGSSDQLEEISWDAFFDKFEESQLAFLYQEETRTGRVSRFSKFVSRGREDKQ